MRAIVFPTSPLVEAFKIYRKKKKKKKKREMMVRALDAWKRCLHTDESKRGPENTLA